MTEKQFLEQQFGQLLSTNKRFKMVQKAITLRHDLRELERDIANDDAIYAKQQAAKYGINFALSAAAVEKMK